MRRSLDRPKAVPQPLRRDVAVRPDPRQSLGSVSYYLTLSTTIPFMPPWVTFFPSTVTVFAAPSTAVA
jgi:hypothetical protein